MPPPHTPTTGLSPAEVLAPSRCALLVIDMQNDFVDPGGAYARAGDDVAPARSVIEPIAGTIAAARAAGVPVLFAANTTLPDGRSDSPAWTYFKNFARPDLDGPYTVPGTWGWEIIAELAPAEDEDIVRKHRSNAFVGTDLDMLLRSRGVETLVSCGVVTNGCVEATVRHAAFLDYYSVLVRDACASSSPALHDAALQLLGARHDLVTAEDVQKIWEYS
ncbi:cysteine hydrolase family protein [Nocardia jinanensis]|uniref:Isochorismatase n=1 Tax=Nocardia jinanensis TaxID=382504 RepID=A0A917RAV5_9NOCA|nr:isochorismatase family cysteine hydrolase [Nocardia jinanensis]GGK99027.1 isochorismatase [Nocardia jinanensis]